MARDVLAFGPFRLDLRAHRLLRQSEPVPLSAHLVDLLALFAVRAGELLTKDALFEAIWPGVFVTDNTLARAVADLRRALGDDPADPRYIQTVARRGYRFVAEVGPAAPEAFPAGSGGGEETYEELRQFVASVTALERLRVDGLEEVRARLERAAAVLPDYAPVHVALASALTLASEAMRSGGVPDREPAERVTWRVADGTTIEGWLVKPVGYRPGTKYPLVLKIHGGPHGAYGNTYFRTFHVLSNAGFFVLYPNPRGSSGYGHAFMYATRGQWGEMDQEDFLTGVDTVLQRHPDIDPQRIGVSGGSYGGFMANWLTARTTRFAAAVTSRSITNWESWYGTSDAQGLTEYEFFGPPWEQRERYRRLSPITYVEQVTAPTLIIHSDNDYRTPIGDGEQWFMALKKRGVPVEMVRYPRSSHGLSRTGEPWLLVDRLERIRSWFVRYLIDRPATPTSAAAASRP